ncbi:zinc-binding metallopeptidase family protein [Ciceribacter selenitireducens]|nr:putative zinc-binding metallopeptidase [Ciceribacter selenitireducens]
MRLFHCSNCTNVVHFDNDGCVSCGLRLGYRPGRFDMIALQQDGDAFFEPSDRQTPLNPCANAGIGACNWLVEDEHPSGFCMACRHNLTIPDLSTPENSENWQRIELAKRHLFYSLMRFGLPLVTRIEDPENGLGFEFLADDSSAGSTVLTGHANGLITLNVAEASDAEREARRVSLGEPFRTLVGHFRHEVGHYYWDRLVRDRGKQETFRAVFGDESQDYGAALQHHYAEGPAPGWEQSFVSAYAASHPWEDFAETWAHYFHIVDALDTADAFGLRTRPETDAPELALTTTFDSYRAVDARVLVDAWVPLTIAINSINRSMGQRDLYPFVLSAPVMGKLQYIHELIHAAPAA